MSHRSFGRMPSGKIVVVGIDTMLGANLGLTWSREGAIVGFAPTPHRAMASAPPRGAPSIARRIVAERPAFVVYCGPMAWCGWDLRHGEPEAEALEIAQLPAVCAAILAAARRAGAHLTVLSTDAVFAGPRLFHPETRPAAAPTSWARTIRRLETSLAREALVVRTCAYGWAPRGAAPTFAERMWIALREGAGLPADPDCYATPLPATDLAAPLAGAMGRCLVGLYHAAGAERISRRRFAVALAEMASLPTDAAAAEGLWTTESNVAPDETGPAGLACETSLDSRRLAEAVGWTPPMVRDGLARCVRQREEGWPAELSDWVSAAARRDAA